jgi:hypothetical protein
MDRAQERIGMEITPAIAADICAKVTDGRSGVRRRGGATSYVVTVAGRSLRCIVNAERTHVVTITEPEWKANTRRAGRMA